MFFNLTITMFWGGKVGTFEGMVEITRLWRPVYCLLGRQESAMNL